jgi:hypothetical protein
MMRFGSMHPVSEWRVPVLRRFAERIAIEYCVIVVASVTFDFGPRFGWWSPPGGWVPPGWLILASELMWFVLPVVILVRWRRVQWPITQRARATGGRVCPQCGYDLLAQDQCGRCPECGEPFSPKILRLAWRR